MDKAFDPPAQTPMHHPPEALLIDYAAGAMSPAETLMIDVHLAACSQCRRAAQTATAIGGALLDTIAPVPVSRSLFERTMAAIDAMEPARQSDLPAAALPSFADTWPAPLRNRLASRPLAPWRRLPAGFRALRVPFADESSRLWIMSAPGGRGPLRHGHIADEWTVVLEGGFTDETGTYAAGDFAFMGTGEEHTMVAEAGEGCVCLLLMREQARYLTLAGKLLAPLLKL